VELTLWPWGSFCARMAHLNSVEAHPWKVEFQPGAVDAHHGTVLSPPGLEPRNFTDPRAVEADS
jgi:hypothetical protein